MLRNAELALRRGRSQPASPYRTRDANARRRTIAAAQPEPRRQKPAPRFTLVPTVNQLVDESGNVFVDETGAIFVDSEPPVTPPSVVTVTIAAAYAAIRTRLNDAWPALEPTIPIGYENVDFQRDPSGSAFLVVEVQWSGGEAITIGAPDYNVVRRYGQLWCHAFVPVGTDVDRALEIAQHAASVFELQQFDGVDCSAMEPGAGQSGSDDGLYFGQSVNVPFSYDETA